MSGTYESAVIAARAADIPVTVIDSGLIGMAMGFADDRRCGGGRRRLRP